MNTDKHRAALKRHFSELDAQQRAQIRDKVKRSRPKNAADKRGKLAFLHMLSEIDAQSGGGIREGETV